MTTKPFSIMIFCWNASGLKFCETMSQSKADSARKGFKARLFMKEQCLVPDFFNDLHKIILTKDPTLIIISTEEEDLKDTYFHSKFLQVIVPELGYSLLRRSKFPNVGDVASNIPLIKVPTGRPSGSALRMSVYVKDEIIKDIKAEERKLSKFFSDPEIKVKCYEDKRSTGAIGFYLWHPIYGKFLFIALHLPSGLNYVSTNPNLSYEEYRLLVQSVNNICLIKMLNYFVNSVPNESKPDYVFLFGDFNYDIVIPNKSISRIVEELTSNVTLEKIKEYYQHDELKKATEKAPLKGFLEGKNNNGPMFLPTWKLKRDRLEECSLVQKNKLDPSCFDSENYEGIGWHDRILYKDLGTSVYTLSCNEYARMDVKNMKQSTHAGVYGLFSVSSRSS